MQAPGFDRGAHAARQNVVALENVFKLFSNKILRDSRRPYSIGNAGV